MKYLSVKSDTSIFCLPTPSALGEPGEPGAWTCQWTGLMELVACGNPADWEDLSSGERRERFGAIGVFIFPKNISHSMGSRSELVGVSQPSDSLKNTSAIYALSQVPWHSAVSAAASWQLGQLGVWDDGCTGQWIWISWNSMVVFFFFFFMVNMV